MLAWKAPALEGRWAWLWPGAEACPTSLSAALGPVFHLCFPHKAFKGDVDQIVLLY